MRQTLWITFSALLLFVIGCSRSEPNQRPANSQQLPAEQPAATTTSSPATQTGQASNAAEVKPKTDACAMLTSKEIESIQGEPLKETKLSGRSEGGFLVSQCFFTLPTFTNSISLAVTQRAEGSGARDPKQFWRNTFATPSKQKEREREREKVQGGEEKEKTPPRKIAGVGDQAFWMGSRIGGALYVLKGNNYVRVSVGGAGDEASKIKRSKALAQKAIARL